MTGINHESLRIIFDQFFANDVLKNLDWHGKTANDFNKESFINTWYNLIVTRGWGVTSLVPMQQMLSLGSDLLRGMMLALKDDAQ